MFSVVYNRQGGMMTEGQSDWNISYCGLNCALCKMVEQGECQGCRGAMEKHWSPDCEFIKCATEKGHQYCFECKEFPCRKLQDFAADGHEHHFLAVQNLKQMREMGMEQWLASQEKPMFCPSWLF